MDARHALFSKRSIYDLQKTDGLFLQAVKENIDYHKKHCAYYAALLAQERFDAEMLETVEDLYQIPVIPASFFKRHKMLSIPEERVEIHATSSGTQGQKSQVFFDADTLGIGMKMVMRCFGKHKLISPIPANYIVLGYQPAERNEMGAVKTAMGASKFAPALHREFALRWENGEYIVNRDGLMRALLRYGKMPFPVRLIGFPSYLYYILQFLEEKDITFSFNRTSRILLGGGWKGFEGKPIAKPELYALAKKRLGIHEENIRDFYSAVEHSIAYAECSEHHFHVPIWSRVIIRDIKTLQPVPYGTPGLLSFVTPLYSTAPLTSVMMGDLAVLHDGKDCACGIKSPYFEVLGRAGIASMRNCAVSATEYMRGGKG